MKIVWLLSLIFLLCSNCKPQTQESLDLSSFIPSDAEIIITVNSLEGLENGLKNNPLTKDTEAYDTVKTLKTLFLPLLSDHDNNSIITLSKDSNGHLKISFIIRLSQNDNIIDALEGIQSEPVENNRFIQKIENGQHVFYSTVYHDIMFISNTLELTKNASQNPSRHTDIFDIYKVSNQDKMISVVLNHNTDFSTPLFFTDSSLCAKKIAKQTVIDVDISKNTILANGVAIADDSTDSLIHIFKNTNPQNNKLAEVLPTNIKQFTSFTFDDFSVFRYNLSAQNLTYGNQNTALNYNNIVEIGQAYCNNEEATIIRSLDAKSTLEKINLKAIDNYRNTPIYSLETSPSFLIEFNTFLGTTSGLYLVAIDYYLIVSDAIDFLKTFITSYHNKNTLKNSDVYTNIMLDLSDASSLLIYGNEHMLSELINLNFKGDMDLDRSHYKSAAIQYVYDTHFAHIAAVAKPNKLNTKSNTVSEDFNTSLEHKLLTHPQFVKNHKNNQMDIIVQDINNSLYLISNDGKVFWKKQLDGKILGRIHQIDSYNNGRLQFVFNTAKRVYVLDRNGRDVDQFPLKFTDNITQPIAVFDYDKNKKYRLLVVQGKALLMYDKTGKRIAGFKYKSAKKDITSQPKHFRIASKDYIVFKHGNTLEVLDRKGLRRARVKESIDFSDNAIYLYNNKFTTSNTRGELLEINEKGQIASSPLNLGPNHKITTTSKTLVSLNDNKLSIKTKTVELDFGDYTRPKIFYINDKIYVTVTDLQSNKAYLFDSQANPIANFPIYANSPIDLNNSDKDSALEVVTKGDDHSIIVYEIN